MTNDSYNIINRKKITLYLYIFLHQIKQKKTYNILDEELLVSL